MIGLIILIAVTILAASYFHLRIRSLMKASLMSAGVSVFILQALSYIQLGHLDKFFPIAIAFSTFLAFSIALVYGVIVRSISQGSQHDASPSPHNPPDDRDRHA